MRAHQAMGTGPLQDTLKFLLLATLAPILTLLYNHGIPSVRSLDHFSVKSPCRDNAWAETVVHPVLLWHPFPRKVLIAGDGTRALVKEALRHFTATLIHWIDSSSPDLSIDDDILNRTVRHSNRASKTLLASGSSRFDVIILDDSSWSSDLIRPAAGQLSAGGVLAVLLPNSWEHTLSEALAVFKHVHLFTPLNFDGRTLYYAIATNSDAYPPPQHLSVFHVDTLIGRRIAHKSSLEHYDGETHLRNCLLQRHIRDQLRGLYQKSIRPMLSHPDFSPYESTKSSPIPLPPKAVTLTRDFVQCDDIPSSEQDAINILVQSLKNGEATGSRGLTSYSWSTYQNVTTHSVPGLDPELDTSKPVGIPAHLAVTAIYDGGTVDLHILPRLAWARASITNFNGWVAPDEIMNSLGDILQATRSSGSLTTGPPPLIHSSRLDERLSHLGDNLIGSLDYWGLNVPYWVSPKIDVRISSIDASGTWANSDISEGEVLFRGPIESDLIHREEYKHFPMWRQIHIAHFGEQAYEEVLVAPPSRDQMDLCWYTNHNCSPNIKYVSYDEMVAIRNITAGEEVTFDYATSDSITSGFECQCGSNFCRHALSPGDWESEALVARLGKEAFWPNLKAKIMEKEKGGKH